MPTGPEQLLAEDGSVRVPARLANSVFAALVGHLAAQNRTSGGELSPEARSLLHALHRAASGASPAPISSEGNAVDGLEILGAHEVAEIIGCSRRTATSLLGSGRLRAWQVGRIWVTTRGDLDSFRFEEPAHADDEDHLREQTEQR
ncbi:helix-turn-helix domain-containing protein [Streptomyces sp. NPDC051214]|uniref:helix-turn-helix domain-containing protein n=1 Tax=Streptomyces sp. NPDC051214 TaxID=3155282 RepID=UPI00342EE398